MNTDIYSLALPDVLPIGAHFQFEVKDAGVEWDKESMMRFRPGEVMQYRLWNDMDEIWIMRCACSALHDGETRYHVVFGPGHSGRSLDGEGDLSLEELREAVWEYLMPPSQPSPKCGEEHSEFRGRRLE